MQISAIVPVRNEENSIAELLDGLLAQTLPPSEIVITDGGSTDQTTSIVDKYISNGAPIRLIRAGLALPGRGRNLAAAEARGEWLAFIDAGIRPAPDWLQRLTKRANEASNVDVVYGGYEPVTDSLFTECSALAYVPPPKMIDGFLSRPRIIPSALMRKRVWEAAGGFPEHLRSAEDLLFMRRVEAAGANIVYEPTALVRWSVQPTFARTFKRFTSYAYSNIQAGLWRQWQARIFERYALLALSALPAFFVGYKWLIVPVVLWILMLCARAITSIWRNRSCFPAGLLRNLVRILVLVPLIATLDAAAFAGTLQWLLKDKLRFTRKTVGVGHGAG